MKKKKILVTGGAGFIGAHLCRKLLDKGNDVVCLDNLSTGHSKNISDLIMKPEFHFVKHDIIFPYIAEIDEIYNLACPASPIQYKSDPVQTMKSCLLGSINMLELARKSGAKILQASTSEVYGDPEEHPQTEAYHGRVNSIGERSCYNEAKRGAESLFFNYRKQYKVKTKIARIFNTYGPGMQSDDGRVISNFITQALRHEPLTVYGNGKQTRSFCYIDDMIEGLILTMDSSDDFAGPVNLGNPTEVSILDLADQIIQKTQSESKVNFQSLPKDDPKQRRPSIEMAKKILAWSPLVKMDEGLDRTIHYYKDNL